MSATPVEFPTSNVLLSHSNVLTLTFWNWSCDVERHCIFSASFLKRQHLVVLKRRCTQDLELLSCLFPFSTQCGGQCPGLISFLVNFPPTIQACLPVPLHIGRRPFQRHLMRGIRRRWVCMKFPWCAGEFCACTRWLSQARDA